MFHEDDETGIGEFFQQQREKEELDASLEAMRTADTRRRVNRFLDELTGEQLVSLGIVLGNIANDENGRATAQNLMGQVATLCRVVHKICILCGDSSHVGETHDLATAFPAPEHPHDKPLSYEEAKGVVTGDALLDKYNVYEIEGDGNQPHHYRCKDCHAAFATLHFRAKQGVDCPACKEVRVQ